MDVSQLVQHFQYAVPVALVLICAVLVFTFGFKNAEQPSFAQFAAVSDLERKQATKKKSKSKEKRAANQVSTEKSSPVKKFSPTKSESSKARDEVDGKLKERKDENTLTVVKKEKNVAKGKENKAEHVKNKKNLKNLILEKPIDFDEGDWEQAYSRKKKKTTEETPKKIQKAKKNGLNEEETQENDQEKLEVKDKVAKESENKELKEKNQQDVILEPVQIPDSEPAIIEEKIEMKPVKKLDKPEKEEKKNKKKSKKSVCEVENIPDEKPIEKVGENIIEDIKKPEEPKIEENISEKPVAAFDELGDAWTEAKTLKKSKKKARRDN